MIAKIKADYDLNRLVSEWNGIEKTLYIYLLNSNVRINKKDRTCQIGNFMYSPYKNLGKANFNIPQIIIDMALAGVFEKGDN